MDKLLKDKCDILVQMAKNAGADSCDVILSKGNSFSLSAQNNEIDKYKVSGAQVIGVRVIKDSKVGLSYSESLDEESLKSIAKAAVESAVNSEVNEFETISIFEGNHNYPSEYVQDETISTQQKIDFCLMLESEVKSRDSRVQSVPYNGYVESTSAFCYLNSHNVHAYKSDYYQTCYTSALIKEGDKSSSHSQASIGRSFKNLNFEKCISESLEHASLWLDATALKTGNYDIVFTPDAFSDFFNRFSGIFSAKGAMEKTNPFADKLGAKIASSFLTVKDIPLYKDTFSKSYFDSEGVSRKDLTLIENGKLNSFYHNTATANYFQTKTTGHASRGAKSALGISGTTRIISEGTSSENDVKSFEYFEIHYLQGLHSGSNFISGEFSFAASGYLCRDGKMVQPVKGVTVSGNFYEMLLNLNIIGNTVLATNENDFFAPLMRFEKISVAGI